MKRYANLLFLVLVLLAFAALALEIYHYRAFQADDAFISFRYTKRLLQGKGLTWSDDQRTEGYTNLLWVLLCAVPAKLGIDLVTGARGLAIALSCGSLGVITLFIAKRFQGMARVAAAVCSLLPFALSAGVAVWTDGMLEQPLLLFLVALALFFLLEGWAAQRIHLLVWASVALGLATLTRADGLLYPLLLALAFVAATLLQPNTRERLPRIPVAALLMTGPAIATIGQLAFRRWYYHEWLPNTAYVKVAFTLHRVATGSVYVAHGIWVELGLFVLASAGIYLLIRSGRWLEALLFTFTIVGILGYLVLVGGDIFPAYRHFVPLIAVLAFAAAYAGELLLRARLRTIAVGVVCLLTGMVWGQSTRYAQAAYRERWEAQDKRLAFFLREHFPANTLIVVDAAGALPYYTEFPAIDALGLNDHHIAHMASQERGKSILGHELGDGKYVLDRNPDILIFENVGGPGYFASDEMIMSDPRFAKNFVPVTWTFTRPEPFTSLVFVRKGLAAAAGTGTVNE